MASSTFNMEGAIQQYMASFWNAKTRPLEYCTEDFESSELEQVINKLDLLITNLSLEGFEYLRKSYDSVVLMSELSTLGKTVKAIHPFNTIDFFHREEYREKMRNIFMVHSKILLVQLVRENFIQSSIQNLREREDLLDRLPHFSQKINIPQEELETLIKEKKWQAFINTIIFGKHEH